MNTNPKLFLRRARRRRPLSQLGPRASGCRRSCFKSGEVSSKSKVSEKLEALKKLIPTTRKIHNNGEKLKADQLFQETADYILVLRTQVVILQKMIKFYGNGNSIAPQNETAVL